MKKITLLAVSACFLLGSAMSASAADWHTCSVERLGLSGEQKLVKMTGCVCSNTSAQGACDTATGNVSWVEIVKQGDGSLATVLTAVSLGKQIKIQIDASAGTFPAVESIYMEGQ